jgi:hypothetical protein
LDLTNVKLQTAVWPPPGLQETTWLRMQPLLSVEELRHLHLFGVDLSSKMPDPITGQKVVMSDGILQRHIEKAVELAETETGLTLMPATVQEQVDFDRPAFESFGWFQVSRTPVWGIEKLTIRTPQGLDVYQVPNEWITTQALHRGRINIVPLTAGFTGTPFGPIGNAASGGAGAIFLASLGGAWWIPAYWGISYLAGFPDGMLPATVNDLVGTIAAMEILSQLASTWGAVQSASIGLDGFSQSTSNPGPQIFKVRMDELKEKRAMLVGRLKTAFGKKFAFRLV